MAETVLMIDDEVDFVEMISMRLEAAGFSVVSAGTAQEGIEKAIALNPALIILDCKLPDMHGLDVCGRLKEDQKTAAIPIVMSTGMSDDEDKQKGVERGVDAYLVKPFDAALLVETIHNLLSR